MFNRLDTVSGLPSRHPEHVMMKTNNELNFDPTDEFAGDSSSGPAQRDVEVQNGIVMLNAYLDGFFDKWSAEQAAENVAGD
jgi:hypothetical protein